MSIDRKIACVTGASGMIGSRIISNLINNGYRVRALSRSKHFDNSEVESFIGNLEDRELLKSFVKGASYLFHCAAELNDETRMWDVNFEETKILQEIAEKSSIEYFCYISSAGVIGLTNLTWIDEDSLCRPQNTYERSKWEAEKFLLESSGTYKLVILRPTNVIDDNRPGALGYPIRHTLKDRLLVFLKGGECAHLVHAEDVATAAIYFTSYPLNKPECFFVSCDSESLNTFAGLWSLYKAVRRKDSTKEVYPVLHLPLFIPWLLRSIWRGKRNMGNVRYSSQKLLSTGFKFPLGIKGAIERICETDVLAKEQS